MRLSREAWASGRGKLFVVSLVAQDRSTESTEFRSAQSPGASGAAPTMVIGIILSIRMTRTMISSLLSPLSPEEDEWQEQNDAAVQVHDRLVLRDLHCVYVELRTSAVEREAKGHSGTTADSRTARTSSSAQQFIQA